MDVCVVIYRNTAERIVPALRPQDTLLVHDNTRRNIGFAAGANAAAAKGTAPIIAFVNPDGDPAPDCFEELERALDDPSVVAAGASQGDAWDRPAVDDAGGMDWLSGGCIAVRRDAFESIGGFDERLFMYGEDVDLSYKLARIGKLRQAPRARFGHDTRARSFRANHRAFRNWLVVHRRHGGADPVRMLRDAVYAARTGHRVEALARVTGVLDYGLRARRWV